LSADGEYGGADEHKERFKQEMWNGGAAIGGYYYINTDIVCHAVLMQAFEIRRVYSAE
jgi:hypothetical protein